MQDFIVKNEFLLRNPLYPINKMDDMAVWNTPKLLYDNEFMELIYSSSQTLYNEINNKRVFSNSDKILLSLRKYFIRSCSRCTPFQMLTTYSLGKKGRSYSPIILDEHLDSFNSFDSLFLYKVVEELMKSAIFKERILFYSNPSIYKVNNNYHYIEYTTCNVEKYQYSKIDSHILFEQIFKNTVNGADLQTIRKSLCKDLTAVEIIEVLDFLIKSKLIISEFECVMMTKDQVEKMFNIASQIEDELRNSNLVTLFLHLNRCLKINEDFDSVFLTNNIVRDYYSMSQLSHSMISSNLFSCNIKRETIQNKLDDRIYAQLEELLHFYFKICTFDTSIDEKSQNLVEFKKAFLERYGEGRKVSVLEVLDPIIGLGYPCGKTLKNESTLLKDIVIPDRHTNNSMSFSYLEMLIYRRLNNENIEVVLNDKDFEGWNRRDVIMPTTFYVVTEMFNNCGANILHLKNAGGKSAIQPLLRYEEVDKNIKSIIMNLSEFEDSKISDNYIYADIIFTTGNKIDNLLIHGNVKKYELIFKTHTNSDIKNKILLSDLSLFIDRDSNLKLWSKRLKKCIIPLNYTVHNDSIDDCHCYRFFSDFSKLFYPDCMTIPVNQIFKITNFFPRIRYKNCILFPASWHLSNDDIKWIRSIKENEESLFIKEISKWRIKKNIPKRVLFYEYDRAIVIDFTLLTSIEIFFSVINESKPVWIFEYLHDSFNSQVVDAKNNNFANEFVFFVENHFKQINK